MLCKLHILHLWGLLALIGCTLCELRYCTEEDVTKCIDLAIRSYVENTQGEEAAKGPLDMTVGKLVTSALGTSLHSNPRQFNQACSVLAKVDMDRVAQCMDNLDNQCTMEVPKDHELSNGSLPSVGLFPKNKMASLFKTICAQECYFFGLRKAITTMLNCYTRVIPMAALAGEGNLTNHDCRIFDRYMQCQWNNSVGFDVLETITRHYISIMQERIVDCEITFPSEVFADTSNRGESSRPSSILQAVFMYGIMIHALSSLDLIK